LSETHTGVSEVDKRTHRGIGAGIRPIPKLTRGACSMLEVGLQRPKHVVLGDLHGLAYRICRSSRVRRTGLAWRI
jgi:hypothetical protein